MTYSTLARRTWQVRLGPEVRCLILLTLLSACSDNPGVGDTTNVAPEARLLVIPEVGTSRTHFSLDPQTSSDVDDPGSTLQFRLDLDNDGVPDTPWSPLGALEQRFAPGIHELVLDVRDPEGLIGSTQVTLEVYPPLDWLNPATFEIGASLEIQCTSQPGSVCDAFAMVECRISNQTNFHWWNLSLDQVVLHAVPGVDTLFVWSGLAWLGDSLWDGQIMPQQSLTLWFDPYAYGIARESLPCDGMLAIESQLASPAGEVLPLSVQVSVRCQELPGPSCRQGESFPKIVERR
ncbi:MAG: hypothetical protein KDC10_07750 [Calditrichaeota bacterium]|nr:hypothetical protein [Calditrichota bacterium]MCB9474749.1 hypothetical protein [Candidatus Delongbacteria bacterium]